MRVRPLFFPLLLAVCAQPGPAFVVKAPDVPIERLIRSTRRYLRAHPDSHEAHYMLARLHYLAFVTGRTTTSGSEADSADELPTVESDPVDYARAAHEDPPDFAYDRRQRAFELASRERHPDPAARADPIVRQRFWDAVDRWEKKLEQQHWTPATSLPVAEMVEHAGTAVDELHRALALSPENPRYLLMLASLTEEVAAWCELRGFKTPPKRLRRLTYQAAKQTYLWAFRAANASEPKPAYGSEAWTLSREAGEGYLRLAHGKADPPPTDEESNRAVAEVESGLNRLEQLKPDSSDSDVVILVSPIVFSLVRSGRLADLLAPDLVVDFDLRGYGPRQRWPWIRPDTALLVWDPRREGNITSGRQLFGGYTFQLLWADGYAALAALDDDSDGVLTGAELLGLRAWFDRNGDGHSEPDEVADLDLLGITGIAVYPTGRDGAALMNPSGLRLRDGSTLPTWDWMAEPVSASTD